MLHDFLFEQKRYCGVAVSGGKERPNPQELRGVEFGATSLKELRQKQELEPRRQECFSQTLTSLMPAFSLLIFPISLERKFL